MKNCVQYGILVIVFSGFAALQGHAQVVSPRSGEAPKAQPQTLTLDEFNRLPNEVQVIMKQHPEMYIIDQGPKVAAIPFVGQGKAAAQPEGSLLPVGAPLNEKASDNPSQQAPSLPEQHQKQLP